MDKLDELRPRLEAVGQAHILKFADGLNENERKALATQIESIDLEALPALVERYVLSAAPAGLPEDLEPAPYFAMNGGAGGSEWDPHSFRRIGEDLIESGKLACFTVAGGQGSRLGFDGPKGCYPASCVTGKSLFQVFAEKIRGASREYVVDIPWYIMTSPLNDAATRSFFKQHGYFGLDESLVMFFTQGTMPSFDAETGRLLLATKGTLATNPDGHGGAIGALWNSGAIADMKSRGIAHISYFQVDNPSVNAVDPVFLGLHVGAESSSGQMSSKMVAKASADEKVGVFVESQGRLMVVEYSDLPEELATAIDDNGKLRFNAGSIAIHMISVGFVERLARDPAFSLPFHRALKKIPHVNLETGELVTPDEPNGVKLERFIFDAISMADSSIVMETDRVEEFAPIKNARGVDSIETSRGLQTEKAARWLESAGVQVPRAEDGSADCVIELSGLTAVNLERLDRDCLPTMIERGQEVVL